MSEKTDLVLLAETMGSFKGALVKNGFTEAQAFLLIHDWFLQSVSSASAHGAALAEILAKANMLKPSS